MGLGFRLCLCLLLAFAVISSARNTVFLSAGKDHHDEMGIGIGMGGRSFMASSLDDYGEPSANRGHDPPSRGGRGGGGRKG
ncbi:Alternative NAD(P)H dehydrogenase [Melia azedarach]|uniref:Alternative NAD(P)H dehydrogenase n=1 Tax=Melia azedarach TaxID=155640 RepID=A0ACC1YRB8_MELAZ|nr:Alternative NAD(P)H dehydrogenase [Melia azedarach]